MFERKAKRCIIKIIHKNCSMDECKSSCPIYH